MIRITVELIPHGDYNRIKKLGEMNIINDGSGTVGKGNYDIKCYDHAERNFKNMRIENHPRTTQSIWQLIKKVFDKWQE